MIHHTSPTCHSHRVEPSPPTFKSISKSRRLRIPEQTRLPLLTSAKVGSISGPDTRKWLSSYAEKKNLLSTESSGFDSMQDALLDSVTGLDQEALELDEKWGVVSRQLSDIASTGSRRSYLEQIELICRLSTATVSDSTSSLCARMDLIFAFCKTLSPVFHNFANCMRQHLHIQLFCSTPTLAPCCLLETSSEYDALCRAYSQYRTYKELHGTRVANTEDPRMKIIKRVMRQGARQALRRVLKAWHHYVRTESAIAKLKHEKTSAESLMEHWKTRCLQFESRVKDLEVSYVHLQVRTQTQVKEKDEESSKRNARLKGINQDLTVKLSKLEEVKSNLNTKLEQASIQACEREKQLARDNIRMLELIRKRVPKIAVDRSPVRTELCDLIQRGGTLTCILTAWVKQRTKTYWSTLRLNIDEIELFVSEEYSSRDLLEESALNDITGMLFLIFSIAPHTVDLQAISDTRATVDRIELYLSVVKKLGVKILTSPQDMMSYPSLRIASLVKIVLTLLTTDHVKWLGSRPEPDMQESSIDENASTHTLIEARLSEDSAARDWLDMLSSCSNKLQTSLISHFVAYLPSVSQPVAAMPQKPFAENSLITQSLFDSITDNCDQKDLMKKLLTLHLERLRCIYDYYSLNGGISKIGVQSFLKDIKFNSDSEPPRRRRSKRNTSFVGTTEQLRQLNVTDSPIPFVDFLLLLVKIAVANIQIKGVGNETSFFEKLHTLLHMHVLPNAFYVGLNDWNSLVMNDSVNKIISENQPVLQKLYTEYCTDRNCLTFQGFRQCVSKAIDDGSVTQISLQHIFQKVSRGEPVVHYSCFHILLTSVCCYRNPAPFYPLHQKLLQFLNIYILQPELSQRKSSRTGRKFSSTR